MDELNKTLGKWWILLVLGILAIALGIWMFANPVETFSAMSTILMILFLAMGVVDIIYIIINRKGIPAYGWNLAVAILIFALGIAVAVRPLGSEVLLAFMFAIGIFFCGLRGLANSFTLKAAGFKGWWATLVLGIINTIFGCVLLFNPMFSVYIYAILLGIAILITGVNLILTAVLMSKTKSAIAAGMIEM